MNTAAPQLHRELTALLSREWPGFAQLIEVQRLSGGASQDTYRLLLQTADGAPLPLCLRRSTATQAAEDRVPGPDLAGEAELIRMAAAAGVPVPTIHYVLQPADGLGNGFIMAWLDGETLGTRIVRGDDYASLREGLAYRCGELLGRIHEIDIQPLRQQGVLVEFTPERCVRDWWQRAMGYDTPQPMIDYTARWLLDHLPRQPRMTLVHGDFRTGNLLVDRHGVRAVLDWELAHLGDPVRDLGWLCTNAWRFGSDLPVGGFGGYNELLAGYEHATRIRVDRAHLHFWQVFGSFCWSIVCMGMAWMWRQGEQRDVERVAIGRRSSEGQLDCVNLLMPGPVTATAAPEEPLDDALPTIAELLESVHDLLANDLARLTEGRLRFLTRVARNSIDIALRDRRDGSAARAAEQARLKALLGGDGSRAQLRQQLSQQLRDGRMALDKPGLAEHLRQTVFDQVRIDQPGYSGLRAVVP